MSMTNMKNGIHLSWTQVISLVWLVIAIIAFTLSALLPINEERKARLASLEDEALVSILTQELSEQGAYMMQQQIMLHDLTTHYMSILSEMKARIRKIEQRLTEQMLYRIRYERVESLISHHYAKYYISEHSRDAIIHAILEAEDLHEVDPSIVLMVIAAESSFRPDAISSGGASGIMQLMVKYWPMDDPFDIRENILTGTQVLSTYYHQLGNWDSALAAYNVGITAYRRGHQQAAIQRYLARMQGPGTKYLTNKGFYYASSHH